MGENNNLSIIVASNRGALNFEHKNGKIVAKRGAGGLVTALTTAIEAYDNLWISTTMNDADRSVAKNNTPYILPTKHGKLKLKFVAPGKNDYKAYYKIISNQLLWFCYHYLWKLSSLPSIGKEYLKAWESYEKVNKMFARAILEESARSSKKNMVFLQDYHLLTTAKYIREADPQLLVSHFSHTAWPQPDYLSILPREIVNSIFAGMLSCNLLGFQSEHYKNNFLLCCKSFTDNKIDWDKGLVYAGGRTVKCISFPISIDCDSLYAQARSEKVLKLQKKLEDKFRGKKILLRIERSDPIKNTLRGIQAYDRLLEKYPELKEKVVYLCLLYSSRSDIREYRNYHKKVEKLIGKINEKYGEDKWMPVYYDCQDNYDRALASLKIYDVLVVNSIYDGMNLISKEGPLINENSGVLILSENTGSFSELGKFVLAVNPFDIEETAGKMYEGLAMSKKNKEKLQREIKKVIHKNTAKDWLQKQIDELLNLKR